MPLSDRGEYVASLMKQGAITEFRKRGSVSTPRKTTTSGAGATYAAEEEKDAGSEEDDEAADVEAALKRTRARISDLESVLSRAVSPRVKSTPSLKIQLKKEQAQEAKLEERLEQLRGDDDEATERDAEREELAKTPFKESVSQEQRDAEEDFWQSQQSPLPSPRGLDVSGDVGADDETDLSRLLTEPVTPVVTATAVSGVTTRPAAVSEATVIERGVDNDVTAIESNIAEGKVVNSEAMLVTAVEETGGDAPVASIEGAKDKMAKQKDTQEDQTQVEEAERLAVDEASNAVMNRAAKEQAGAIAGVGMVA